MPVVSVGQKLPSIYLDRFQPVEGLTYRISVLDTNAIATEFHFIDIPSRGVKGSYQCIQGACCAAFGRRSQTYNVPIYVYRESQPRTTDGELQVWRMTAPQWKKFSDMAMAVDFKVYDIMLVAQKRGYGMDLTYSAVPDVKLRDYWSPEQREQIPQSVESFYQLGEASLTNPMAFNDWNQLLYECGFDLQNMQWPGGQSPMSQGNAQRSVGRGFGAAMLPQPPSQGILPPVPGMAPAQVAPQVMPQGVVGLGGPPVMQPTPPAPGAVPMPVLASVWKDPAPQPPVVPVQTAVFPAFGLGVPTPGGASQVPGAAPSVVQMFPDNGTGTPAMLPTNASPQSPPQPQGVVQFPGVEPGPVVTAQPPQAQAVTSGVPLGTAPVIPQTAMPVPVVATPAPQAPDTNTIPGQQEITMEEMNELLS
jgi:hypothetical protein